MDRANYNELYRAPKNLIERVFSARYAINRVPVVYHEGVLTVVFFNRHGRFAVGAEADE